jgi:hypothetical protein
MLEAAIDQVRGVLALLAAEGEMARDGARADGRRARGSLNTCAGNVLTVCVGGQLAQFDCASLVLPVAPRSAARPPTTSYTRCPFSGMVVAKNCATPPGDYLPPTDQRRRCGDMRESMPNEPKPLTRSEHSNRRGRA